MMLHALSLLNVGCIITMIHSFSIIRTSSNYRNTFHNNRMTSTKKYQYHISSLFYDVQEKSEVAVLPLSDDILVDTPLPLTIIASSIQQQYQQNERQSKTRAIITNYTISDMFHPVPWLQNNHIQTIGGYIFRKLAQNNHQQLYDSNQYNFAYIPRNEPWYHTMQRMIQAISDVLSKVDEANDNDDTTIPQFWDRRERINTPDGDFFHVDIKHSTRHHDASSLPSSSSPSSIVLLLHGLQSNSNSPVCMEMASAILYNRNKDNNNNNHCECHCINFRGCSGVPNDTVGGYHLGYTDDVKYYLQQLYQQYTSQNIPYPPIYITGFSLGANVALKCIGELGRMAQDPPYNIHGASVLCLPLDQVANAPVLAQPGINRFIYTQNLLQSLQRKCTEQYEQFYGGTTNAATPRYNYTKVMMAQTITEFDDSFIAPIYNFTDCWDYYTQTSSIHYIHNITVPTLVINAQDDPFFDNSIWPTHHSVEYGGTLPIKMIQTKHGGHLGYYFHQIENDDIDERFVGTSFPTLTNSSQMKGTKRIIPSWSAWETGKFINHVHSTLLPSESSQ